MGFPHTAFQAALLMHKLLPPCIFSPWHTWSVTQHTLLGFIPASGNGCQFFWHHTQKYNILFPHAKCSRAAWLVGCTELIHRALSVLLEPQPPLELCCQMGFGGTFDSLPKHRQPGQSCHSPGNCSTEQLLRDWSCISVGKLETPAIIFIFLTLFLLNTSANRGHKEYPSSYMCILILSINIIHGSI